MDNLKSVKALFNEILLILDRINTFSEDAGIPYKYFKSKDDHTFFQITNFFKDSRLNTSTAGTN